MKLGVKVLLKLPPMKIGLFQRCILEDSQFAQLTPSIVAQADWNSDLKNRRDPVAHRIPLAIPPQVLTPAQSSEYQRLSEEHGAAAPKHDTTEYSYAASSNV